MVAFNEVHHIICHTIYIYSPFTLRSPQEVRVGLECAIIINTRHEFAGGLQYLSCVCVRVSVILIPANQAIVYPTKGSSGFSYILVRCVGASLLDVVVMQHCQCM